MKLTRGQLLRGAFHVAMFGLIGYLIFGFPRSSPATVALDGKTYRITGPYTHENLAVYLIHADTQDGRSFITLDEGLKSGVVKVSEKSSAQVNELTIENTSDDNLFLQEGDRVKGGQQDRTIYTSLVVPPHSGKLPLPAFCVEPSRWAVGTQGTKFGATINAAVCPKEIRLAAKVQQSQGEVWAAVARQKQICATCALSANTNSSLNESLDAPKVKRIADEFAQALNGAIEGQEDAVGVVIAINGRVEEVNFYLNRQLLGKQYPRLVQSYSLTAKLMQKDAANRPPLSDLDVGRFVWDSDQGEKKAALAAARRPATTEEQNQFAALRSLHSRDVNGLGAQMVTQQFQDLGPAIYAPVEVQVQGQAASLAVVEQVQEAGANERHFYVTNGNTPVPTNFLISNLGGAPNQVAVPRNIRREEAVNADNKVEVVEQAAVVNCKTTYQGQLVHRQYLSRNRPARGR